MAVATERFVYAPPLQAPITRGSFFKRLVQALKTSREAQARREIARYTRRFDSAKVGLGRDELPF